MNTVPAPFAASPSTEQTPDFDWAASTIPPEPECTATVFGVVDGELLVNLRLGSAVPNVATVTSANDSLSA